MSGLRCGHADVVEHRLQVVRHPAQNERAPLRLARVVTLAAGYVGHPAQNERAPLRLGHRGRNHPRALRASSRSK